LTNKQKCDLNYFNSEIQDTILEEWLGGNIPDFEIEKRIKNQEKTE